MMRTVAKRPVHASSHSRTTSPTSRGAKVCRSIESSIGKTDLARAAAAALARPLSRLQCYEGLDEAKALYEWEYAKQLLYTQILKDKLGEITAGAATLAEAVER